MMLLIVGKKIENGLGGFAFLVGGGQFAGIRQAYVALSAIGGTSFAEVGEQLATSALFVVVGTAYDGLNALGVLLLSLLIDAVRNVDVFGFFPSLQVGDERGLAARNEMQDSALVQCHEDEISLLQV